jgi:hypothetical protein
MQKLQNDKPSVLLKRSLAFPTLHLMALTAYQVETSVRNSAEQSLSEIPGTRI